MKWIVSRCPICGGEVVKADDFPDDFGYMWQRVTCSKGHNAIVKRAKGENTTNDDNSVSAETT